MTQAPPRVAGSYRYVAPRPPRSLPRATARGVIGAMAMSGLRQFTTAVGLVRKVPPEAVLERAAPEVIRRVPAGRRPAMVELTHWSYGAFGGLVFGLLPWRVRRRPWVGPLYGLAFWAVFEAAIAPVLGMPRPHRARERVALLVDHLVYGTVVGASPWPHQDVPDDPPK